MVVDAADRHPAGAHRLAQHAQPAEVGDIEHDDAVGAPQLLHGLGGPIHAGKILEEEVEPGRRRGGVGDHDLHAPRAQQMGQPGFAAESVSVRVDMGGEADPLSWMKRGGECPGRLEPVGGEGEGHSRKMGGSAGGW
jgi:hypothetical protein